MGAGIVLPRSPMRIKQEGCLVYRCQSILASESYAPVKRRRRLKEAKVASDSSRFFFFFFYSRLISLGLFAGLRVACARRPPAASRIGEETLRARSKQAEHAVASPWTLRDTRTREPRALSRQDHQSSGRDTPGRNALAERRGRCTSCVSTTLAV